MTIPALSCVVLAGAVLAAQSVAPQPSESTFVGTTPCGESVRAFVVGTAVANCPAVRWELTLGAAQTANRWALTAIYGSPLASGMTGTTVTKQGTLTRSTVRRLGSDSTVFRLTSRDGSSIAFAQIGADLLNLASAEGSLAPGTPAYSYTLTRADRVEPPVVEVPRPSEGSYTVPPRENGPHVFGIYEGRSPYAGLARESGLPGAEGLGRVKWRVTLLKDPRTISPRRTRWVTA